MTGPGGRTLLVTGGSGYLGGRVACLAAAAGWDVVATYHSHPVQLPGVRTCALDVTDGEAVQGLVEALQPAAVVHTAFLYVPDEPRMRTVNVDATRAVARAAASRGSRLVHVSSDVIFDGERGGYTEEDPPSPITPYGRSKADAEAEVRRSAGDAVCVRTSLITGLLPRPDERSAWVLNSLRDGRELRLFTDELRNPVWIESLAAALLELLPLDYRGVLNVAGARVFSRYELGVLLARCSGLDPAGITPTSSRDFPTPRPRDCTLDLSLAYSLLQTPLPGIDEVLWRESGRRRTGVP